MNRGLPRQRHAIFHTTVYIPPQPLRFNRLGSSPLFLEGWIDTHGARDGLATDRLGECRIPIATCDWVLFKLTTGRSEFPRPGKDFHASLSRYSFHGRMTGLPSPAGDALTSYQQQAFRLAG